MALSEGWTQAEAAGLVGCARTTVGHWAAGHASRKEPAYLPYDGKRGLAARLPAGERAEDLASEGGVSAAAVRGWARRLAEEGELALMSDEDARVRSPEPAGPPAELEALRRRCEELELENAILAGTVEILKKRPRRRPFRPDGGGEGGAGGVPGGAGSGWLGCSGRSPCRGAPSTTARRPPRPPTPTRRSGRSSAPPSGPREGPAAPGACGPTCARAPGSPGAPAGRPRSTRRGRSSSRRRW